MLLTKQDKVIASITVLHGTLGSLWAFFVASQNAFPVFFLVTNSTLAAMGLASGVGSLLRLRWALHLMLLFYLIQLIHVFTQQIQFSFTLGANFIFSLGWWAPNAQVGINIFALIMLVWSSVRAVRRLRSDKLAGKLA